MKSLINLCSDIPINFNKLFSTTLKATKLLHNLGQSLWLDTITRDHRNKGTIRKYIDELSVTGLTSNPTIFEQAIKRVLHTMRVSVRD
jgi:hypothetical protein